METRSTATRIFDRPPPPSLPAKVSESCKDLQGEGEKEEPPEAGPALDGDSLIGVKECGGSGDLAAGRPLGPKTKSVAWRTSDGVLVIAAIGAGTAVWLLSLLSWPVVTAIAVVSVGAALRCRSRQRRVLLWLGRLFVLMEEIKRMYLVSRRPRRIVLLRHGQSEGNADRNIYSTTPDHELRLTALGEKQAQAAGERLRELLGDDASCFFYISPYTRCRMTYQIVRDTLRPRRYVTKEDPRLREQDFGNFQAPEEMAFAMKERCRFGRFWYRFKDGESGADVFDRASTFWESLFRSMEQPVLRGRGHETFENYILVTHGLMIRLFLMRYFQWTVEDFLLIFNPGNCDFLILEKEMSGAYRLVSDMPQPTGPGCAGPDKASATSGDATDGGIAASSLAGAQRSQSSPPNGGGAGQQEREDRNHSAAAGRALIMRVRSEGADGNDNEDASAGSLLWRDDMGFDQLQQLHEQEQRRREEEGGGGGGSGGGLSSRQSRSSFNNILRKSSLMFR